MNPLFRHPSIPLLLLLLTTAIGCGGIEPAGGTGKGRYQIALDHAEYLLQGGPPASVESATAFLAVAPDGPGELEIPTVCRINGVQYSGLVDFDDPVTFYWNSPPIPRFLSNIGVPNRIEISATATADVLTDSIVTPALNARVISVKPGDTLTPSSSIDVEIGAVLPTEQFGEVTLAIVPQTLAGGVNLVRFTTAGHESRSVDDLTAASDSSFSFRGPGYIRLSRTIASPWNQITASTTVYIPIHVSR